jgi:hyperpolarization activated cyclic nucleotide-gated potassium channel 2
MTCILIPDSLVRIMWDVACMFIIMYEMIMIPFRISFVEIDEPIFYKVDLIFDCIFMTDIVLNFNTAIFRKGNVSYF